MKKLFLIFCLFIFTISHSFAGSISDFIKPGMTKQEVKKITNGAYSKKARDYRKQTELNGNSSITFCYQTLSGISRPGYRYFKDLNVEIMSDGNSFVYYVFENVKKPAELKGGNALGLCFEGDGILRSVHFGEGAMEDASHSADPNKYKSYAQIKKENDERKKREREKNKPKTVAKKPEKKKLKGTLILRDCKNPTTFFGKHEYWDIKLNLETKVLTINNHGAYSDRFLKFNLPSVNIKNEIKVKTHYPHHNPDKEGTQFIIYPSDGYVLKNWITKKKKDTQWKVSQTKNMKCAQSNFATLIGDSSRNIAKKPETIDDGSIMKIGSGTGFVISKSGHVISNNHVVGVCKKVMTVVDGKEVFLDILATDKVNDLGLIKGKVKTNTTLSIKSDGAELGEDIVAFGYPLTQQLSDSVKVTKGIVSALSGMDNNYSQIQIDAAIQPGNSGGPVLNMNGQVVGVASSGLSKLYMAKKAQYIPENVNFAVASPTLSNFLKANKINFSTSSSFRTLSTKDLAKIGRPATIQLFCMNTRSEYAKLKKAKTHSDMLLDLD